MTHFGHIYPHFSLIYHTHRLIFQHLFLKNADFDEIAAKWLTRFLACAIMISTRESPLPTFQISKGDHT
jgi:hypothetical protein